VQVWFASGFAPSSAASGSPLAGVATTPVIQ
jgi:hypothetical protein